VAGKAMVLVHRIARLNNSSKDWNLFKQLRNKVVDTCRMAKREYLDKRLDKNKEEPKQMWRLLKEMLKDTHNREYKGLQCGNRRNNNVKEMADVFNKYFVDNIREIAAGNGKGDLPFRNEHPICVRTIRYNTRTRLEEHGRKISWLIRLELRKWSQSRL